MDSLEAAFDRVANFCAEYRKEGPVRSNAPLAQRGKDLLQELGATLEEELDLPNDYRIKVSPGVGYFPYVPWVAVLAPDQKVSDGVYVAVCFDHSGRGAVAGLLKSVTNDPGVKLPVVQRNPVSEGMLDVDSPSGHAPQSFNDAFHNPEEFRTGDFSGEAFIDHMQASLRLYSEVLAQDPNPLSRNYFAIRLGSATGPSSPEVEAVVSGTPNPFEVSDIYWYKDDIAPGDPVFVVLGGGKEGPTAWDKGLAAVAKVDGEIYDLGYKETGNGIPYFRIRLKIVAKPSSTISLDALTSDSKYGSILKETSPFGRNRANQPIRKLETEEAKAVVGALLRREPDLIDELANQLPREIVPTDTAATSKIEDLDPDEREIYQLLMDYGQVILYGPPGTGKTHKALRIARSLDGFASAATTVFHPSYGYEDFIGGLRPRLSEGMDGEAEGSFSIEEYVGVFQRVCDRAEKEDGPHLLVIDEINRGDIARIFGEVIYGLEPDKRGAPVALPYLEDRDLVVPPNVFIIGTMNTSDRSIAQIDVALRRRFAFYEVPPEPNLLSGHSVGGLDLGKLLSGLNHRLLGALDRDHLLGHAYFYHPRTRQPFETVEDLHRAWYGRIMPLMEEYFFGSPARVRAVLGKDFVEEEELIIGDDGPDSTAFVYHTAHHPPDDSFIKALRDLVQEARETPSEEEVTVVEGTSFEPEQGDLLGD